MPQQFDTPIHPDFESYVPDEVVSLRQLQVLYGSLKESKTTSSVNSSSEYSLFFTPDELTEFVASDYNDESRLLVLLHVDSTGPAPTLVDVSVRPLTADFVPLLGYSRYPWGQAIDHSLTQRGSKSGSSASDVSRYARNCLLQWTNETGYEPAIGELAKSHPDGWLIDALAFAGGEDELYERLEYVLEETFESTPRVVVSVATRVDINELENKPVEDQEWYLPGELDVFNDAMRTRKVEKLSTKHGSQSRGQGVGMVKNESGELVGTADDPLGFYSTRQVDTFALLDRDAAWRSHPVSVESALLMQSASQYLDACRWTRDGLQSYLLPYPKSTSDEAVAVVRKTLESLSTKGGHPVRVLASVADEFNIPIPDAIRFCRLIVNNEQGDISVYSETNNIEVSHLLRLFEIHQEQFDDWLFSDVGFSQVDDWLLLSPSSKTEFLASVLDGRYAALTLPVETQNKRAMIDNPVEQLTTALLNQEKVDFDWLLRKYLEKLRVLREEDTEGRLSHYHVMSQLSQLYALSKLGVVSWQAAGDGGEISGSSSPNELHKGRLTAFAEQVTGDSNSPLVAAFNFGATVGQASALQRRNGRALTLDEQYPSETFSPTSKEAVRFYARDLAQSGSSLRHELLQETLTQHHRFSHDEFREQPAEMRFYIALGSTFGRLAYSRVTTLASDQPANVYTQ